MISCLKLRASPRTTMSAVLLPDCVFMLRSCAQDARERVAVSPDKKDQQDRYDAGHWQTAGVHQDVNEVDVHNDGSEQNQTERHEASDKQEQSPDDLEYADDMKVTGHE